MAEVLCDSREFTITVIGAPTVKFTWSVWRIPGIEAGGKDWLGIRYRNDNDFNHLVCAMLQDMSGNVIDATPELCRDNVLIGWACGKGATIEMKVYMKDMPAVNTKVKVVVCAKKSIL